MPKSSTKRQWRKCSIYDLAVSGGPNRIPFPIP